MAITQQRATRCAPANREAALIAAAHAVLQKGALFCASTIALEAQVSPSLVKHYLYPMHELRQRLVDDAVAANDARRLAPLLTWPEARNAPQALRQAAAQELIR